jgi:hypothetical protein
MKMVEIAGNGLIERWEIGVDEEVMVPRIGMIGAGGCNPNVGKPEMNDQVGGTV